jgi:hypothetical protein
MRIEPKTFFANERTFLSWLHMSITIGSIAAAMLGFAGTGTTDSKVRGAAGAASDGPAVGRGCLIQAGAAGLLHGAAMRCRHPAAPLQPLLSARPLTPHPPANLRPPRSRLCRCTWWS